MIVDDSHFIGAVFCPTKDDAPLLVNANRMKAFALTMKRFQLIPGWNGQIIELSGLIHLNQFSQCNSTDRGESPVFFLPEKLFGIFICKGLNHS